MYGRVKVRALAFSLAFATTGTAAAPAFADGTIVSLMSDEDNRILAEFDTRRAALVAAVTAEADAAAGATLAQVLVGQALPFDDGYDPSGDWRCRFLTLGGESAVTVHDRFSCRIFDDGAGWVIRKAGVRAVVVVVVLPVADLLPRLVICAARPTLRSRPRWRAPYTPWSITANPIAPSSRG
jgi:hypothetical protein